MKLTEIFDEKETNDSGDLIIGMVQVKVFEGANGVYTDCEWITQDFELDLKTNFYEVVMLSACVNALSEASSEIAEEISIDIPEEFFNANPTLQ